MRKYQILLTTLAIMLGAFLLSACKQPSEKKGLPQESLTYTVESKTTSRPLFFSGRIQPLQIYQVTTPVKGIIEKVSFKYGQSIKKGQELLTLLSDEIEKEYQSALTEFLQKKDEFVIKSANFEGAKELWAKEFISKNIYLSDKSQFDNARLNFIQAKRKLEAITEKIYGVDKTIANIGLQDIKEIEKALSKNVREMVLKAEKDGIALFPDKETSGEGSNSTVMSEGAEIKAGQVIVSIGDMTGVSLEIYVNEVDVDDIKLLQKVTVTGAGFPGVELHGYISGVDAQAKKGGAGLPTFPVRVIVPKLPKQFADKIHVGMSAKVQLNIEQPDIIYIPLQAVYQKDLKNWVDRVDPETSQPLPTEVITGKTTLQAVEIKQGLTSGDKVRVNREPAQ